MRLILGCLRAVHSALRVQRLDFHLGQGPSSLNGCLAAAASRLWHLAPWPHPEVPPKLSTTTVKGLPYPVVGEDVAQGGRGGQDDRTEDEGRAGGKEGKGAGGENVTRGNQGTDSNVAREVFGLM